MVKKLSPKVERTDYYVDVQFVKFVGRKLGIYKEDSWVRAGEVILAIMAFFIKARPLMVIPRSFWIKKASEMSFN